MSVKNKQKEPPVIERNEALLKVSRRKLNKVVVSAIFRKLNTSIENTAKYLKKNEDWEQSLLVLARYFPQFEFAQISQEDLIKAQEYDGQLNERIEKIVKERLGEKINGAYMALITEFDLTQLITHFHSLFPCINSKLYNCFAEMYFCNLFKLRILESNLFLSTKLFNLFENFNFHKTIFMINSGKTQKHRIWCHAVFGECSFQSSA